MGDTRLLVGLIAGFLALVSGGLFVYFFFISQKNQPGFRSLMNSGGGAAAQSARAARQGVREEATDEELERLKTERRGLRSKKNKLTLEERFFRAGMFSDESKKEFARMRLLFPVGIVPALIFFTWSLGPDMVLGAVVLGALVSLQIPYTIVDRRIKRRSEEILFYLPLVIEQIAIGVSSSLDIGPCLQRVVSMADERDSHNVVTELVRHAQFYVKSGVSLEDALLEVGKLSGHTELKHSFIALSQVAKHGGEISRQLQELADAVSTQRETLIEAKIKRLELEATAPVALVFFGFLVILLIGFGLQIKGSF